MKIFVKDFCETVQARVVIFGEQVDNYCIEGLDSKPAFSCLFFPVFVQFSLNDEIFRQRFLHNLAR